MAATRSLSLFSAVLWIGCADGGSSGGACPTPVGPTVHDSAVVLASETWTAAGSPHDVLVDTLVAAGATLTLEPCTQVRIAAERSLTVMGRMVASGTPSQAIQIGARDTTPWASIATLAGGTLEFKWTTVKGGGNPLNADPLATAMLDIRGEQSLPTQEIVHVDNVSLEGSASQGVLLTEGGGFSKTSSALRISGSAGSPLQVWARAVGTIPQGTYTGNGDDQILVPGIGGYAAVVEDTTMRAHGVPYRVGTPTTNRFLQVGSGIAGTVATLTIEAGVTVRFMKEGILQIEPYTGTDPATGALVAVGTPTSPIVFTSAESSPGAGDWYGLYFGSTPSTTNRLEYVQVRYAGALQSGAGSFSCTAPLSSGSSEAAIRILGGAPASAFVVNSLIADSAGYGFDRGWTGSDAVDFTVSNTFENLAWCRQTAPIPPIVGCSATTVSCP